MNTVPIAFCADENYATYVPTLLRSVMAHASHDHSYHFYFLYHDVCAETLGVIKNEVEGDSRARVTFIDVNEYLDRYSEIFTTSRHLSRATYARFFIPEILSQHDVVVYLDIDVLVKSDVAALYEQPLNNHMMGGVADVWCEEQIQRNHDGFGAYTKDVLKLPTEHYYFNAGILLLNAKRWRMEGYTQKCLEKLHEIGVPRFFDQCTLNSVCANDVFYLPAEWNCTWSTELTYLRKADQKYQNVLNWTKEAQKHPKIIHFIGGRKAWHIPIDEISKEDPIGGHFAFSCAVEWWEMVKRTKSYPWFLSRNKTQNIPNVQEKQYFYFLKIRKTPSIKSFSVFGLDVFKRTKQDGRRRYELLGFSVYSH